MYIAFTSHIVPLDVGYIEQKVDRIIISKQKLHHAAVWTIYQLYMQVKNNSLANLSIIEIRVFPTVRNNLFRDNKFKEMCWDMYKMRENS